MHPTAKKKQTLNHATVWMSLKYTKRKNSNADDYIFYGSILMKPPEKANLDTESSLRVTQGEEWEQN